MWGDASRFYWGRKDGRKVEGTVVVFAWMSSQEKHLKNYVQLYSSLGWNSLVCHYFFPEKATLLAFGVLNELVKELKIKPHPVVFASFSGGPKACMYKVLQIIEGKCEETRNLDEYRLVRDCLSGYIYDSSPVDFTSDLGTRFVLHPTVLKVSRPPRFVSLLANAIASGLDSLFLSRFEAQRAEYWQTLYSTVSMGVPYLILCSENDDLAPYQTISNFTQRLQDLGGDVKLMKWNGSPHVGHYRHYPSDYEAAVTELLQKAAVVYSQGIKQNDGERMGIGGTCDEVTESSCNLQESAIMSNQGLQRVAVGPSDHFLHSSVEYVEDIDVVSVEDEQKAGLIHLPTSQLTSAHGVLSQILFDVCVPKNIEDWDLQPSCSTQPFASVRRRAPCNPIKCILRSRL